MARLNLAMAPGADWCLAIDSDATAAIDDE
jgi:hypothetical protein